MHLLAQEEYGLRCLLQVAHGRSARPLTISEISAGEGLSAEYTAKLMRALRQGGLVVSTRGAGGGYRLARPANAITVWDVIQVLGSSFFPNTFCDSHPGQRTDCVHTRDCAVRSLWSRVETVVHELLESITLADLNQRERPMLLWLERPKKADPGSARTVGT